jgi:acyltransferase
MTEVRQRIAFIDTAKAIGIVLVVVGHTPGMSARLCELIYSFHMPLFFFISGYLLPSNRHSLPLAKSWSKSARTLLVPYLFFFAISLLYWLATRSLGGRAAKFAGVGIGDALAGLASGLSQDLFVNPALWFFPCLFICAAVYALLRHFLSAWWCFGASLVCLVVVGTTLPWPTRLPWGLDIAWVVLPFYAFGAVMRSAGWRPERMSRPVVWGLTLVLLVSWYFPALTQGRVDLAFANFGPSRALYCFVAAVGIAMLLLVSTLLPHNRLTVWLADNSLIIFPLHPLLLNFASGVFKMLKLNPIQFNLTPAMPLILFVWVMLACIPLAYLLRKRFSLFLGRSSSLSLKR